MKLYYFCFLLLIFACNNSNKTTSTEVPAETETETQNEILIEKKTTIEQQVPELKKSLNTTFKDYKIEAKAEDGRLKIAATNPKGNALEVSDIELKGDLKFVEILDMNSDGRPEICAVENTSTGEKLHVCSLTPFSALSVQIPMMKLANFQGDDAYRVENGQLMRSYTTTSGKTAKIAYNLVAGEAGFRLEPHGIRADEMNNKVFGTYFAEAHSDDYTQKLTITDNGLGEIVINIIVTSDKSGKPYCSFDSVGELVRGRITAPLNFRMEGLKGTMLLTQMDNGWKISTTKEEDATELMKFCQNEVSLAGKYHKIGK